MGMNWHNMSDEEFLKQFRHWAENEVITSEMANEMADRFDAIMPRTPCNGEGNE